MIRSLILGIFILQGCLASPSPRLSPEDEIQREEQLVRMLEFVVAALRSRDLSAAEAYLKVADELSPLDPRVADARGCVLLKRGDLIAARLEFQQAIALNPKFDRPYEHLAFVAEKESRVDEARELLRLALQINPLNIRARNNLAILVDDSSERRSLLTGANAVARGRSVVVNYNLSK